MRYLASLLAILFLSASCTGVPASGSARSDGGTSADSDTQTGDETDTATDHPFESETCWGTSLPSQNEAGVLHYTDGVVDVESFSDGSSLAAMASGTLYKHDPDGNLLSAWTLGSADLWVQITAVEIFPDGDVAVLGMLEGTPSALTLGCDTTSGGMVLARYSSDSTLEWARAVCTDADDVFLNFIASGLGVLTDGSIIVAGMLPEGSVVFGAGEPNETALGFFEWDPYEPGWPIFVARYLEDGTLDRVRIETKGYSVGREIAALPDGSFAVSGSFKFEATFGEGQPNETTLTWSQPEGAHMDPVDGMSMFVAEYEPDGVLAWVDGLSGYSNFHYSINLTPLEDGAIAAAGDFTDALELSDGTAFHSAFDIHGLSSWAMFVAVWNKSGELEWATGVSGADDDIWGTIVSGVVGLPYGRVAVAGVMLGAVDFGNVSGTSVIPGIIDDETVFLVIYGTGGDIGGLWRIGDEWSEFWEPDISLASTADGAFLLGGAFEGSPVIRGLDGDSYTIEAHSDEFADGFIIRACPK